MTRRTLLSFFFPLKAVVHKEALFSVRHGHQDVAAVQCITDGFESGNGVVVPFPVFIDISFIYDGTVAVRHVCVHDFIVLSLNFGSQSVPNLFLGLLISSRGFPGRPFGHLRMKLSKSLQRHNKKAVALLNRKSIVLPWRISVKSSNGL